MSKQTDIHARIDSLEAELASLRRQAGPRPKAYVEPRGVEVRTPPAVIPADWPTEDEFRRLREAVFQRYPTLRPPHPHNQFDSKDLLDHEKGFAACFAWVAQMPRQSKLNNRYARSWWTDRADAYRQRHSLPGEVDAHGCLVAVIAQGVLFTLDDWPYNLTLGLDPTSSGHRLDSATWRGVLANGVTNEPKVLERARDYTQPVVVDLMAPRWSAN